MNETDVVIVGGGPAGLVMALDLARRGVRSILVERLAEPMYLPKMERSNPRTMEIFRILGLSDKIRAKGYPSNVPMDALICTNLTDPPLLHLPYPSVDVWKAKIAACQDGTQPAEPYQLISQYTLEPLLFAEAKSKPEIQVRQSTECLSFSEHASGVEVTVKNADGVEEVLKAKYLAACDGGRSVVRSALGIKLSGTGVISAVRQIFFKCPEFFDKCQLSPGRHYSFANVYGEKAGVGGVIVVQDDRKHFTYQSASPEGTDFAAEIRSVTGLDIQPQIITVLEWRQNLMVADSYTSPGGRVYLAGDAVHLFIPAGGLGMNTAICDGFDLSWKLAGTIQGWGGSKLLTSYQTERKPIGKRNTDAAGFAVEGVVKWRSLFTADVLSSQAHREAFTEAADPLNRRVYEMIGTELGYRYESPIVCKEEGLPPPDDSYHYVPSTWPGRRVPHVWLDNGLAMQDRLGNGYVLLKLGATEIDTDALEEAMRSTGAPFEVLRIRDASVRKVYERNLILVRPDLHVAWRGDGMPESPQDIAAMATGH